MIFISQSIKGEKMTNEDMTSRRESGLLARADSGEPSLVRNNRISQG